MGARIQSRYTRFKIGKKQILPVGRMAAEEILDGEGCWALGEKKKEEFASFVSASSLSVDDDELGALPSTHPVFLFISGGFKTSGGVLGSSI